MLDNTEFVFRFPVKSSYLSLLLSPQYCLLAHTAFCTILTAVCQYKGTYVRFSRQQCPHTFIHKFRIHIRLFAKATISFVMTIWLSVHPFNRKELGF
jgi:hypothetical protein